VRRDLGELWDEDQGQHALLAVQDIAAPCMDAAITLPTFDQCRFHLAAHKPIANYVQLGLPADAMYFNGGMLVADLAEWRRKQYAQRMLACLREYHDQVLWWDQYALNVVLAGQWRALDSRWNQGAHLFVYPTWRESPLDRDTFVKLRNDPWIVHFCSPSKPWHYFCPHPFRREFLKHLRKTAWRGWQAERPENYLRHWWEYHYHPLRRQWDARARVAKKAVGIKRQRAA
jgi:lipopolysaccharide biosynthesis glycosyltransferase